MAKNKPKLIPLNGRVLIERKPAEHKTPGGIIIPETAQEHANEGCVLAAHDEAKVKVDDFVLFGKYAGTDMDVDGLNCVLVKEEDLIAKIER